MAKRIVSTRVIENYWDCPYCNTTHIQGLKDYCPGCGVHKPDDTKYKLDKNNHRVVTEDLAAEYGKTIDGLKKLPDWKCEHCNSLNDAEDDRCETCGSPRYSAEEYYFGNKLNEKPDYETDYFDKDEGYIETEPEIEVDDKRDDKDTHEYEYRKPYNYEPSYENNSYNSISSFNNYKNWYRRGGDDLLYSLSIWAAVSLVIFVVALLFWPIKEKTIVNGFSWSRNIVIEEERTFNESGWSIPAGARVYKTNKEVYDYKDVLDHYEYKEVTKTHKEYSHDEITYDYIDNGNGTTTEVKYSEPIYVDVEYTETEEVPVYRKEPVYKTKYYYEIDRYIDIYESKSAGNDKNPYWNESYELKNKQRDTERYENYVVKYDNGDSCNLGYNQWLDTKLGDTVEITKCRLGLVYKQN